MNLWDLTVERLHRSRPTSPPAPPGWDQVNRLRPAALEYAPEAVTAPEQIEPEQVASEEPVTDEREYAENHRDEAVDEIRKSGFEAIAFYAPIHYYSRSEWGVYFNERMFYGTCAQLHSLLGNANWNDLVNDVYQAIERHELFHAAVELFALLAEDFHHMATFRCRTDQSEFVWGRFLGNTELPDGACAYDRYKRHEYDHVFPGRPCQEEQLATARQFQAPFKVRGLKKAMATLSKAAPPAYQGWEAFVRRADFVDGVQSLGVRIACGIDSEEEQGLRAAHVLAAATDIVANNAPKVWFPETAVSWLDSKGPIPRRVYRPDAVRPGRFNRAVLGNARLQDLLHGVMRHYGGELVGGGKHPAILLPNGKKIPYKHRVTVHNYVISELAVALGISRKEILANCLGIRV